MITGLRDHQSKAVDDLRNGSILCGGVGSGKSRTAIAYFLFKECGLKESDLTTPIKQLYIITTPKKRDSKDWEKELANMRMSTTPGIGRNFCCPVIDSWNNIGKYTNAVGAFFIFDEQRVVGNGAWVKSFLTITKKNHWILLSATPGDTWSDYIPVFLANGFYKNRTDFVHQHIIFSPFTKYPKIDRYVGIPKLVALKNRVIVYMDYKHDIIYKDIDIFTSYDKEKYQLATAKRWNPYKEAPIETASEYTQVCRRIVGESREKVDKLTEILLKQPRVIIFYNYDYELDILRKVCKDVEIPFAELNGHKHMDIPKTPSWAYLVQYASGNEAWECIETNFILFYSNNHSYKVMTQAKGRIDRMNTPFDTLWTVHLTSHSPVDNRIRQCLKIKKKFNENDFGKDVLGENTFSTVA